MKERIYTIPLNDAFNEDCECPMCFLENKLEEDLVNYYLGPSLMEPDNRLETNKKGFCRRHFEMLYSRQENTLGLALIIETHLEHMLERLREASLKELSALKGKKGKSIFGRARSMFIKDAESSISSPGRFYDALSDIRKDCALCGRLNKTMDRYIDVMFYLWRTEPEFKEKLESCKGFCLSHLVAVLAGAGKHLKTRQQYAFMKKLHEIQLDNMDRILDEIKWFTKKFDYRYKDEPWKNSKDAVPRAIQKITSFLKRR
jgi:hypothetical protein